MRGYVLLTACGILCACSAALLLFSTYAHYATQTFRLREELGSALRTLQSQNAALVAEVQHVKGIAAAEAQSRAQSQGAPLAVAAVASAGRAAEEGGGAPAGAAAAAAPPPLGPAVKHEAGEDNPEELFQEACDASSHLYDLRVECARAGQSISAEACLANGCCWRSAPHAGYPWCYHPMAAAAAPGGQLPYDVSAMAARGAFYAKELDAAQLLLMTAIDVLQRHGKDWLRQPSPPSFSSGADLTARFSAALSAAGRRVCQAPDVLLVAHLITADDAWRLEEWLLWHRALGVDHVVVHLNGHRDGSRAVLAPFVEAGWASVERVHGAVDQTAVVNGVVALLERKACHFSGTGDIFSSHDCGAAPQGYAGYEEPSDFSRAVWLAPWDTDEFLSLLGNGTSGACAQDLLRAHSAAPGLAAPWVFFGHGGHALPPPGLVTAAFLRHAPYFETMYKFLLHVRFAQGADFRNGHHVVVREGAALPEDELLRPLAGGARHDFSPLTPATALVRLNHYVTGSTQQLLKKWLEGVIGAQQDPWTGTPMMRSAAHIAWWLRQGAEVWTEQDARDEALAAFVARALQR